MRIDFPYYFLHLYDCAFVVGHVHWFVSSNLGEYIENLIIAFDLKSEYFHEVLFPHLENRNSINLVFVGTASGCFYSVVFVIKKSWTKAFSIF